MESVDLTAQQQQTADLECAFCSRSPGWNDTLFFFPMEGAEHISLAAVHLQPRGFLWMDMSGDVPISYKINWRPHRKCRKENEETKQKIKTSSNTGEIISPKRSWKEPCTISLCLWEIYLVGPVGLLSTLCSLRREINHLRLNNLCSS